jgi:hypothetical protein
MDSQPAGRPAVIRAQGGLALHPAAHFNNQFQDQE